MSLQITPSSAKNIMFVERESSLFKFVKPAILVASCFFVMSSLAQTNTNVKLNGNAAVAGDFIGTTNNENLVIKTNGQNHTIFQKDGDLKVAGLQGAINRLLCTNASGVIKPLAEGTAGQVLLGDLTWGTMPVSYWNINANGNKLFTTINKVGINTNNPAFNLDVNGDGHFSGNLVLNGELIINEKITSPKQLTTAKVVADSIMMGEGKALYGETTIKGDVKLKYTLDVTGNSTFHGDQSIDGFQAITGGQSVNGNQNVNGSITARQGLTFDGTNGFRRTVNASGNSVYKLGGPISTDPVNPCEFPNQSEWFYFGGKIQLYDSPSNTSLTMGSDGFQSIIESEGNNKLLLNWYCGKDVSLCTGANATSSNGRGGVVRMGHNVMIGGPWPPDNYDVALNINGDEQTGLFVKSVSTTNPYNYGVVSSVNGLNNKAFAVLLQNENSDKEIISLRGNGEAFFGTSNPTIKPTLYVSPSVNASNQYITGKVGIGTDAPATALDVNGDITVSNLGDGTVRTLLVDGTGKLVPGTVSSTSATAWSLGGNDVTTSSQKFIGTTSQHPFDIWAGGTKQISIRNDGKTVFGTSNLAIADYAKLNVTDVAPTGIEVFADGISSGFANKSQIRLQNAYGWLDLAQDENGIGRLKWANSNTMSFKGESILIGEPSSVTDFGDINTKLTISTKTTNGYTGFPLKIVNPTFTANQGTIFEILLDGTTHIGNTKPTNAPYSNAKLSVDGSIIAKEIFVRDQQGAQWADYVFAKDYKLMPLKEVEKYVIEYKHLPNVPSAKEIDEKGQGLGALQVVQMEKIEELYLHLIELSKKVEKLEKENAELKTKIKS
ncbi:MAG: hypothetical protein IPG89_01020 [Bacteroidetes bacterium]|nr:hypothetical protein [Bacteroidota bacterium]